VDGGRSGRSQHCGSQAERKVSEMLRRMQTDARGLRWTLTFGRSFAGEVFPGKDLRILR
jgi:hypothetical protein